MLRLASEWQEDGPFLPIEFSRVADGGELSTALTPGVAPQLTWWALVDYHDLSAARQALEKREEVDPQRKDGVGYLPCDQEQRFLSDISVWANGKDLDAVIWTALPPRFADVEEYAPTVEEVLAYLESLDGEVKTHEEHYIRSVPSKLSTMHRSAINEKLGWIPKDSAGR